MGLKVLINGAGICGPALSIFLQRSNSSHEITVVERSPSLRVAGQQIDLRAQGIAVMRKMGLLDTIKTKTVAEQGLTFIDANGRTKAVFGKNDSGKGQQAFTSEYEIMRGDLVDILYQESLEVGRRVERDGNGRCVRYEFGKYATELRQDGSGVDVTFSDGTQSRFDLVVGADGQGSRTRRMAFGKDLSENVFKPLGAFVAFFSIPKGEGDGEMAKVFHMPEYRIVSTRTGDRPITQAYLAVLSDSEELKASTSKPVQEQKALWKGLFEDCTWQRERLLEGLEKCDDFYAARVGQVKTETWSSGHVALLGDAGYCPSLFTGMGTTASLVGAYVLAGELARHDGNIPAALESYNNVLQPFVTEIQKLIPGTPNILYPKTEWGIWFLHTALGVFTTLKIDKAINMLLPEDKGGWKIPEYPELKLES
ncbi:uncharacterized protein JN550_008995 [Neoarthrinium moseri]|uniref:uncharacterized protein n=1 Tax=Neoarthrinium moseri TaxID=1658444 RepID=UPI001FDB9823|nr:uncharacterized protein JN550_008995 [Neoarthrinium moseri]KAI1864438.1 hypothetical protein JN550_008995 [Neoarthrinium moseri]